MSETFRCWDVEQGVPRWVWQASWSRLLAIRDWPGSAGAYAIACRSVAGR